MNSRACSIHCAERFTRRVCGKRGADVRPDFNWDKKPVRVMGYR
jgi:hypothetical protein